MQVLIKYDLINKVLSYEKFKTYKYDVQFTSAQGRVSTIILGDFKIDNEVC